MADKQKNFRGMIWQVGGLFEAVRDKHGFMLGADSESKYTEYEIRMEPGREPPSDVGGSRGGMKRRKKQACGGMPVLFFASSRLSV